MKSIKELEEKIYEDAKYNTDDIQIIKYNGIIDNIKKWIEQQKELEKVYKT